jgi:hypothetical protein
LGQEATTAGEECLAGGCELDAATRSLEQGDAELLLEAADLVAQ